MNRRRTSVIGTVIAGILIGCGLMVVGFFVFLSIALANFGSNK